MQSVFSAAGAGAGCWEGMDAERRAGALKTDWTKPGRFGKTIALWALNRMGLFCLNHFEMVLFESFGWSARCPYGVCYRRQRWVRNCPDKPKTHDTRPYREAV
jgi:hypothetical protein